MNSKERVDAAFEKKRPDRTPVNHRGFSSKAASYILGHEAFVGGGIQQWREARSLWEGWHDEFIERSFQDAVELSEKTGQDIVRAGYWRASRKPTGRIDDFTFVYEYGNERDWKLLRFDPASEQGGIFNIRRSSYTLEDIRNETAEEEKALAEYLPKEQDFELNIRAQKLCGHDKIVEISGVGVGIPLSNTEIWFEAMLTDKGLVKAAIDCQVERARRNVEFLTQYGFKYFFCASDFASENGPMYSPALFDELVLPGLKKTASICHDLGAKLLYASDGNLWPVANSLFHKSGIDGYFEIDRKAGMDLERLRKEYPHLTLIGNIGSWTLSQGTAEDIKSEVRSCLQTAREYNGIIAGLSNYILPETPHENIDALLETFELYR